MKRFELRDDGDLSVRALLIVSLLVGAVSLIDQDQSDLLLPQGNGTILEQALEPDLDETKTPALTVLSDVETAVALISWAYIRNRVPEQSYRSFEPSSLSIFQRCSTYRI